MVLTGDITQIDLPKITDSGLARCAEILKNVDGLGVMHLTNRDVVRNKLVKDIVKAFEKDEELRMSRPSEGSRNGEHRHYDRRPDRKSDTGVKLL